MSMYKDISWWRKDLVTLGRRLAAVNGYPRAFWIADGCGGAVVVGYHAADALDNLVNEGGWDRNRMSDEDFAEYSKIGWDDSYILLGNASKPFWTENLHIEEIVF